ncbi:MAG: sensor histidine kinase [Rhodoluna sp.]
MSTLSELNKAHGRSSHADIEWLNLLLADWQLVADLAFADLVLWLPTPDGSFIAAGHARPSSAATIFYRDISGQPVKKEWAAQVKKAFETGDVVDTKAQASADGTTSRMSAIPVRRKLSAKSDEVSSLPIAVVTRHTNLTEVLMPNRLQLNYLGCANDLLVMIADGNYPDLGNPTGPRRGAPRANDGLLRLDVDGVVTFASPNGLSAFNRLGIVGELEGKSLAEVSTPVVKGKNVDESLPLVLTGRAPWRTDMESRTMTLTVRAIPLKAKGVRIGAIVLCRDATELRKQERELITKDATIREIHHRVKNNLQTVASLLRIQARRSESDEAKESLDQAMRRVSAIALVHDTLSEGLNQDVNFDEVFDRILMLATEVASSLNSTVRTLVDGKFGQLKSDIATPLAVALTEIVTNAVEHGLADRSGVVAVNAERKQKQLLITVSDNGKGLAGGKVGSGLGTQIIRTLIEGELRGTIHWSSPAEGGARVAISIPL